MRRGLFLVLVISGLCRIETAESIEVSKSAALDPRIQTIPYSPDAVTLLRGTLGYEFMLEFDAAEKIETVSIGDSQGWQVTPNRKANVLFLKPVTHSNTNLTVLTDQRRYAFELQVVPAGAEMPILYIARMVYPAPTPSDQQSVSIVAPPVVSNSNYTMTGSRALRPDRVFDDGRNTYFEWNANAALPAIFAIAEDGSESLVNYVVRGSYIVVDQMASSFVLRDGREIARIANNGSVSGRAK